MFPQAFGVGVLWMHPLELGCITLHFDWLWFSSGVSVCYKEVSLMTGKDYTYL